MNLLHSGLLILRRGGDPLKKRQAGGGLASTLMASAVIMTLAFAMASGSIANLTLNSRVENGATAGDLAESAAASCLSQVLRDSQWRGDVEVTLPSAPGGWGRVTFRNEQAGPWGVPVSVNNLDNSAALDQLGPNSLRIRAVGQYRGVTRSLTQVIAIPPFRYALASTGQINSRGGLTVASLEDPSLLAGGFDRLLDEQLKAGNMAGNRTGKDSVILQGSPGRPVLVKGRVESTGQVSVSQATVLGGVHENGNPAPVPQIQVNDYDPIDRTDLTTLSDSQSSRLQLDKPTRRQGDLKVTSGLELKGGYLYVDGNLDIYGGLTGKGAIFATGDVKIHGLATFGTNNQEAIMAKGNVGIEGTGRDQSIFQGLIYTEGNLNAKDVTLVGSMVGNGSQGSEIQLDTCNLLYNRQMMQNVWNSGFDFNEDLGETIGQGAIDSLLLFDVGQGFDHPGQILQKFLPKASDFYDPARDEFLAERNGGKADKVVVRVPTINGDYQEFSSLKKAVEVLSQPNHGLPIRVRSMSPVQFGLERLFTLLGLPVTPKPYSNTWEPEVVASLNHSLGLNQDNLLVGAGHTYIGLKVGDFNDYYKKTRKAWMRYGEFGFVLNPNQFLSMSDKMRIMMWSDE